MDKSILTSEEDGLFGNIFEVLGDDNSVHVGRVLVGSEMVTEKDAAIKQPKHKPRRIIFGSTRNVVRHGEITEELAATVWLGALREWGLTDTTADDRMNLRDSVTQALVVSTSKDFENLETLFLFNDKYYAIRPIADGVQQVCETNDSYLRVFVRSFDSAYFAIAMFDALSSPENIGERTSLALRCGGPVEHAPYMIDVFDAVARHSGRMFTAQQLILASRYKGARTNMARESAQSTGAMTAHNDTSSRSRTEGGPSMQEIRPQGERSKFAAVRT